MKIGVLGLGSIGLRHARNLRMLGHEVAGYDPALNEPHFKRLQAVGATSKLMNRDELIEWSEAIVIASPTIQHYQDLRDCAHKKVFVEKPLMASGDYAKAAFCDPRYNAIEMETLFLGYMLRFHPCVKAAKNWIDAGHIGKPLWASFICGQYNDKPDYLRDGVVLNWSHEIDLALYLLGPAKVDAASVACREGRDIIADFVLQHESGGRSTIHLDYVTKNEIREGWIAGSEKNIGLDMLGRQVSFGKMTQQFGGDWNGDYVDEMAAFVQYALGRHEIDIGKGPPVQFATGIDGLRVLEICRQVRQISGLE